MLHIGLTHASLPARWNLISTCDDFSIGNGLEVRRQSIEQPHHLNIALRFPLQTATRLNTVEITVVIELQKA